MDLIGDITPTQSQAEPQEATTEQPTDNNTVDLAYDTKRYKSIEEAAKNEMKVRQHSDQLHQKVKDLEAKLQEYNTKFSVPDEYKLDGINGIEKISNLNGIIASAKQAKLSNDSLKELVNNLVKAEDERFEDEKNKIENLQERSERLATWIGNNFDKDSIDKIKRIASTAEGFEGLEILYNNFTKEFSNKMNNINNANNNTQPLTVQEKYAQYIKERSELVKLKDMTNHLPAFKNKWSKDVDEFVRQGLINV